MRNQENWKRVNQELVAKSIGELTFEQILNPIQETSLWKLTLASGAIYTFQGKMSVWEHLKINPASLKRHQDEVTDAAQFFIDSQSETKMSDIILGNFLEEMHNTLYSDLILHENNKKMSSVELADLSGEQIQFHLNGHPKILLNKGRIGWGIQDLARFAPESKQAFRPYWIAVKNDFLQGQHPEIDLLNECFDQKALEVFLSKAKDLSINLNSYSFIPVHPWQWDNFIRIQFAAYLASGEMIFLGEAGDEYLPQISIRTLSNKTRPDKVDLKLPLSILNTSCVRGLPAQTISLGPEISRILTKICQYDSVLKESGIEILQEKAGVAFVHPSYAQIKEAPYRYHEYLGAIWRESADSKIEQDEKAIIAASLFYQDTRGHSLIGEYIKRSGLTVTEWLEKYFKTVVIPLYHLQLNYGVGMVAHGQNIILKLKNFAPSGMILKDFQGDLRLSTEMPPAGQDAFSTVEAELTKLPPHYLIHDLITGHFITVLRFISEVMEESDGLLEKEFYQILSLQIQNYINDKKISDQQNLLSKTFQRVLLNKVRFAIGYADTTERPLPMVGSELLNPLFPEMK